MIKKQTQIKKTPNPHDRFFKRFYSQPKFALELFQLIFSQKELSAYDWKNLKSENNTLKNKTADLAFSVPLKQNPKIKFKIFILLEHKSHYDPDLFTQLLYYQILLYEKNIRETGYPTPIIPVLFYHGKKPWKWSVSFQDAYFSSSEIPIESRANMLNYKIKLLDTHNPRVQKVFKDKNFKSRGALNLLSRIWTLKSEVSELKKVLTLFSDFSGKEDDLILNAVDYLKSVLGMSQELWEQVERESIEEGVLNKGGYMDIREDIKLEGIKEGIERGIKKGRQEGRRNRETEVVLNMLKNKIDVSIISKATGLSREEIDKIKNSHK